MESEEELYIRMAFGNITSNNNNKLYDDPEQIADHLLRNILLELYSSNLINALNLELLDENSLPVFLKPFLPLISIFSSGSCDIKLNGIP